MSDQNLRPYWSQPLPTLLQVLGTSMQGLSDEEVRRRLQSRPKLAQSRRRDWQLLVHVFEQLRSPLQLILVFGALIALLTREWLDAAVVLAIVLLSALLSAWHESRAAHAVDALRRRISVRATVIHDGRATEIAAEDVVAGDVLKLSAGSLIPADGIVLESLDLFVSESLLTGETFPVEKQPGLSPPQAGLGERSNCVFAGTSVRSGSATMLAVKTGADTAFGKIAKTLERRQPETEFERGLRAFGMLLMRVMIAVVLAVLAVSILLQRPAVDTLLFAIALAVGLSPELLPAILTVTLARGAQRMAERGVIVRRLNAIENLGSMDVLCTDKTGTLTRGVVQLDAALDVNGEAATSVLRMAALNASLQTGLCNALDKAIVAAAATVPDLAGVTKLGEIPYDFIRKRLGVVVQEPASLPLLISKGALDPVLSVCERVDTEAGVVPLDAARREAIGSRFAQWSEQGYRVLGVARKPLAVQAAYGRDDEAAMIFIGFLLFLDPPEAQVRVTLKALLARGVAVKMITGDNHRVARHVAAAVGLDADAVLTGTELADMKDEALWQRAPLTSIFAEVDPNQKERIIHALQRRGHVVGYLGDGINDAPALQAADVGISVDAAVDVAKQAADIVLLRHDLDVLRQGIDEGRRTFANTLKYIFITTSANFGNMISMATATLFLPFLPMLAKQILLNNFLSDIPAVGIAVDSVDAEWRSRPHRWNMSQVRNFMLVFGLVSTLFDLLTFVVLLRIAGESAELFRTGWFVESLLTELLILFVVRTWRPVFRSRPGRVLTLSSAGVALLALALPYLPLLAGWFGLVPMPASMVAAIPAISLLYAAASEAAKHRFRRYFAPGQFARLRP
jgi:Mg2+-importing ATPase